MKATKKQVGNMGEERVCEYLKQRGHCILERNWRIRHLEVDIISLSKEGIHFIEVKTRVAPVYVEPQHNVGLSKQKYIAQAAMAYISKKEFSHFEDIDLHLDVATVILEKNKVVIEYISDAYMPMQTKY